MFYKLIGTGTGNVMNKLSQKFNRFVTSLWAYYSKSYVKLQEQKSK